MATDLEFPDWSGMEDSSQRISITAALELTFQYPKWFPELYRKWREYPADKCVVEFVL